MLTLSCIFNNRQQEILDVLKKNTDRYVTASELANLLSVSTKTIYRDMDKLSGYENDTYKLVSKEKFGYQLIMNQDHLKEGENSQFYEMPQDRRLDMLLHLLAIVPFKTSIQKLSERYYVSQSSILNDFKHIERMLEAYDLILIRENNGTSIYGSSINMKRLMSKIVENYLKQNGDPFSQYDIPDFIAGTGLENEVMESIKNILAEVQKDHDVLLDQSFYLTIYCFLLTLIEKNLNGLRNEEQMEENTLGEKISTRSSMYQISSDVREMVHARYAFRLGKPEFYHLYYMVQSYLINYQLLPSNKMLEMIYAHSKELSIKLIERVSNHYGLRLGRDTWLNHQLVLHVNSMLYRLKHHIFIINPILQSIKKKYSNTYKTVCVAIKDLSKEEPVLRCLTDEEIGYLSVYFQLAIEKYKKKIPALLECSSGVGTSHLLKEKLKKYFPEIHVERIVAQYRAKPSDYDNVDLIISTMKTTKHKGTVTLLVSPMMTEKDRKNIEHFVDDYYREGEEGF